MFNITAITYLNILIKRFGALHLRSFDERTVYKYLAALVLNSRW
ncbi:hypothetical protein BC643_1496 [Mangrovibacterium diazotrophicum]|uniref:Uncharacterized protein n=1 Tax=Mangrovibacterium diazotrophicum TaxID=1261403 RepID=A0A419W6Q6_9BACT|nr:hypothetical protein BC643_1496 [Mangrovibacterium diazotrophicum]